MLMSALALAVTSGAFAQAAGATQRIDMKVLLLGTSTSEPDFASWQAALRREGVPFDTIITSSGHTPITAATLSSTLPNGTQEAKYQAVIVSVGELPTCPTEGPCTSTLTQTEWTALSEYEQTFNVRQITGDLFPSPAYGLNSPTLSGELNGVQGSLTTEGSTVFPYLKGPVPMDTGTYGYEATPLATQATGASFTPLVSGPGGSAFVGVYTHPNGVQEMVETFNENANQLQAELLRHGALNWVTRGVYFGDQRNYFEAHIDDNFLADDSWNTTTHQTDYLAADAIREVPADVEYAAKWAQEHNFRMDMLFNGKGSTAYAEQHPPNDPLLEAFAKFKTSFGWVSHTWDHPNIDIGCATQSYIEAELNQNNNWSASALGLTQSAEPTSAYGNNNPQVIVTGEHSGLANLLPGNPGVVDPPDLDSAEPAETAGTLAAGSYVYAVTDDFTPGGGQSIASVSAPVTVPASSSVTLSWAAVCHAAEFKIYREVSGSGVWKLISTVPAPTQAPPNSWFGDPISKLEVANGGPLEQTFTDTGTEGAASAGPPAANEAVESPYPQNPNLVAAFAGVGIKYFGSDASKPYPDPTIPGSTTAAYPAGTSFLEGAARAIPRYPTNIYYNVSTEAQELDEYNQVYTPVSEGGKCVASPTNTCETKPANFAEVIASIDTNMFQHVMGNDPRPHYFHQPNLMGSPPPGPPTTGTPPNTAPSKGDGLFYSAMNPLLEEYAQYFNVPIEQLTVAQIGQLLAEQQSWGAASAGQVSGYIEGNQVTVQNGGTEATSVPLTGVTSVGSTYGGTRSGWTSAPAATSTYTAASSWPGSPEPVQQEPQGSWIGKVGSQGYLLADWDGTQDVSNMPGVTASLLQGSRNQWATNTSDVRALQGPDGLIRDAGAYNDTKEIRVQIGFSAAYTGNLHLYAVDWTKLNRRETITVDDGSGPRTVLLGSDFSQGAWVSFPVSVPTGGKVSVTVARTAGINAVLSGLFLGDSGAPPANNGQELSKGGWVGAYGSAGYDLAGWDGSVGDASYISNASVSLLQGSRYLWAVNTTDARALSEPGQLTRNAAAYQDANQVRVQLTFTSAYSGNMHLYALDWSKQARRETITVGGQTAVLSSDFSQGAWVSFPISVSAGGVVTITVDRTAGPNAVLSGIFLGDAGSPPGPTVSSAPQGSWAGQVGSQGYLLPDWDGAQDLSYMPGVSTSLLQGSRNQWATNTSDVRALQSPDGLIRDVGAYNDPNQIRLQLSFASAYSGNLRLYAVDWTKLGRRETITVGGQTAVLSSDFSQGAWVSFPISVSAGGVVTITVDRTAGPNAVLSGIFLGDAGSPPGPTVSSAPQGSWAGQVGSQGYLLPDWDGAQDLSYMPGVSTSLLQGSRNQWATNTSDVRALQSPDGLIRDVGAYNDPNQIRLQLSFASAYSGNLRLYAVDWTKLGRRETITVGGQTAVLSSDFSQGAWVSFPISVSAGGVVTITVDRTAGPNAVLSGIFLGDAGSPPGPTVSSAPQGSWAGQVGSQGYLLPDWDGAQDLSYMPGVSTSLLQGSRNQWATNTSDVRALQSPDGLIRDVGAYNDPNQIRLQLSFASAYSGNLRLYAVDWTKLGRRETITVGGQTAVLSSDFSQGAWVSFPISVSAGGVVTITVDRTAGPNAVLSGVFLG
jgi:hypothetical protein